MEAADVIRRRASSMVGRSSQRGSTSISFALEWGVRLLDAFPDRADRKLIDLCAEDSNNDGIAAEAARDAVLERAITINAIALVDSPPEPYKVALPEYLRRNVIGGDGSFVLAAHDPIAFAQVLRRKLVREISGLSKRDTDPVEGSL